MLHPMDTPDLLVQSLVELKRREINSQAHSLKRHLWQIEIDNVDHCVSVK